MPEHFISTLVEAVCLDAMVLMLKQQWCLQSYIVTYGAKAWCIRRKAHMFKDQFVEIYKSISGLSNEDQFESEFIFMIGIQFDWYSKDYQSNKMLSYELQSFVSFLHPKHFFLCLFFSPTILYTDICYQSSIIFIAICHV